MTDATDEALIHHLTMSLWRSRPARRDLARRKTWEPSIDDCRMVAEHQVKDLRKRLVLVVVQPASRPHSISPRGPSNAPIRAMPLWRARPAQEA
jgi:hypothetical protein